MNSLRNIVVTGANKGIGYGIVRGLLQSEKSKDARLILTSRKEDLGLKAVEQIAKEVGGDLSERLVYRQLDIDDKKSQSDFIAWTKEKLGNIHVLVNNAGVTAGSADFDTNAFDFTYRTNYFETVNFTESLLKENLIAEKVIFISSSFTQFMEFGNKALYDRFTAENISAKDIEELALEFRSAIETKTWTEKGWPDNCYGTSKLCLSTYTRYLGKRQDIVERNIQVYACCPGWVRTDMGGQNAYRSLEEGVVTPIYLVELPNALNSDLQGKFFYDSKPTYTLKEHK